MKIRCDGFNIYLLFAVLLAITGCASEKRSKDAPVVRLHLEVTPDGTDKNGPVPIGRQPMFTVNTQNTPFLTEFHLKKAEIVDDKMGGFAIRLQFNRRGSWLLDEYSTANKGRRVAVFMVYEKIKVAHWVAAPVIPDRIRDGALQFTPDLTREEAEQIVQRLNINAAKDLQNDV